MLSWEKGGVAPVYLCKNHAFEIGKNSHGVLATTLQAVPKNAPAEQPKISAAPVGPANAQPASANKDLPVIAAVRDVASGDSEKALANENGGNEANGNVIREDFEAYRPALKSAKPSTATDGGLAERADLERICVSRYGERCTGDASVHCPKCGRWFCDAHGEDARWHACALPI